MVILILKFTACCRDCIRRHETCWWF